MTHAKQVYYLLSLVLLAGCQSKYDWSPSECSPNHYPAKVLTNNYQYENGESVGALEHVTGDMGWGEADEGYFLGAPLKPVPDSLFVNWFSVTERKFYKGRFKLSNTEIEKKLKEGESCSIYTCFAPHGYVVVYVSGVHGRKPVDRFRAIEDTSMTVTRHLLKIHGVKTVQEYEEKYEEKLDGSTYLKHYIKKEDSIYISKHGIRDVW